MAGAQGAYAGPPDEAGDGGGATRLEAHSPSEPKRRPSPITTANHTLALSQREDKRERERVGRGRSWRHAPASGLSPGSDLSGVLSVVPVSIEP